MKMKKNQRMVTAGMLLAVGVLLPFVAAHGLGLQGTVFLPMHIPVFLVGFLCGPLYGAALGALIPALSSLLTGMPAAYPMLPIMACELCVYGLMSGLLYEKAKWNVYLAMLVAMVCGRVAYGAVYQLLLLGNPALKALTVWSAAVTGLPGIAVQVAVVPAIVLAIRGTQRKRQVNARDSAISLIHEETATCVVIREDKISRTSYGSGLKPLLELYQSDALRGAFVVDKIVGKAAAMVLVLGGATEVYGETMSNAAKTYLQAHGIAANCGRCIDSISNREGNGICPMERTVMEIDDPAEGLAALKQTIAQLRGKQNASA